MAKAKKKRSAAQIAATKKMLAANKRNKAGKKSASKPKKKRAARKASATKAKVTRKTKRASGSGSKGKKTMKKGKRRLNRARSFLKGAKEIGMGAMAGGTAATAMDVVLGHSMTPAVMKTPVGNLLTRTAGSFLAGMAIQKITKNHQLGRDAAVGSLAVMVNGVERSVIRSKVPSLQLGEVGDLAAALGIGANFTDDDLEDEIAGLAAAIDNDMDALEFDDEDLDGIEDEYEDEMNGLEGQLAFIQ